MKDPDDAMSFVIKSIQSIHVGISTVSDSEVSTEDGPWSSGLITF